MNGSKRMPWLLAAVVIVYALIAVEVAHAGPNTGNPCTVNTHDGLRSAIVGTNDKDTLTGTDGPDAICGANGADTIYGLGGNDWLNGNHGNDTIFGGDGDDVIVPGKGQDYVDCGGGSDTVKTNFETGGETYVDCESFVDPA